MLPEISVGPLVGLPTYFLYLSVLYSVLMLVITAWAHRQGFSAIYALNLAMIGLVAGTIGARLFHVFYEGPAFYAQHPLEAFKLWQGGFVFYGGMFGAAAGAWIYLRRIREDFWTWADFYSPILALGYGLGRFACFLAGCCYGKVCVLPWAYRGRHPVQLYSLVVELCLAVFLWWLIRRRGLHPPSEQGPHDGAGQFFSLWLIGHSINRLAMESMRDDFRGENVAGLSISTWISLVLLAAGITKFTMTRLQPKRPADKIGPRT